MKDIWSYSDQVDTHTYETHLYRLRQKIHTKLKDKNLLKSRMENIFLISREV
jgi:Transcriptional regulatory protein, C terminal.